ncbi:MAG: Veg family protein [Bacilli bacterium]|nr:Veg family protein [Bacilli bacterium]
MIETIKIEIYNHLNKEVKVVSKENRNRNDIFYGNIVEIYSHVFIVSNGIDKKSYTYSDILARDIQVTFL